MTSNSTLIIVGLIIAGFIITSIGLVVVACSYSYKELGAFVMITGVAFIAIAGMVRSQEYGKMLNTAEQMIQEGNKVYLNGQEIDPDTILLKDYNVTIKGDIVVLSKYN